MYQCPKESEVQLQEAQLAPGLPAQCCPSCGGAWIQPEAYSHWQQQRVDANSEVSLSVLPMSLDLGRQKSPLDSRAALCPGCRHYLVRGRINLKTDTFFVERCPNCGGIWCDGGEWDILEKLGLDTHIEDVFSGEWQAQLRELEVAEREKQATIDKLGPEIAAKVFELASLLEDHPNGDFGVAYLMRRFEQ